MLNGIGISVWNLMLIFFGIICGIGWVHRTRRITTTSQYPGTLITPLEPNEPTDEVWEPIEGFEEIDLVSDADYATKSEATLPTCHPLALMMSQSQPAVPTSTLRVYREN